MLDSLVLLLGLLAPVVVGALLAISVQRVALARRGKAEWFVVGVTLFAALALDLHGEGLAHGIPGWLLYSLPGLLSFVAVRYALGARSQRACGSTARTLYRPATSPCGSRLAAYTPGTRAVV